MFFSERVTRQVFTMAKNCYIINVLKNLNIWQRFGKTNTPPPQKKRKKEKRKGDVHNLSILFIVWIHEKIYIKVLHIKAVIHVTRKHWKDDRSKQLTQATEFNSL